ncbi:hypothetical protein JHD50_10440 [Sulfurimonas sp. MAG313]|nr:hypothetical protein [Sulfurimonas sp. MAG313]MDF1881711.1 hypothetical protein [Sulfurimonas sp. MAG313]
MQFLTNFKIKELDYGWNWPDMTTVNDCEYFCQEELEIPHEFLKTIKLYDEEMHVTLCRNKAYIRDDWYVNLSRISA